MSNVIELTKDDLLVINGGGLGTAFHKFGFRVGQAVADAVDFLYGIFDGINEAYEKE